MSYIDYINNKNLKELLLKKKFSEKTLWELKTSLFIHPAILTSDGYYERTSRDSDEGSVFEIFTSLEEYYKCYDENDEFTPDIWYLSDFSGSSFSKHDGFLINRGSDNILIPTSLARHIICDMIDIKKIKELPKELIKFKHGDLKPYERPESFLDDYLLKYLKNKSKITYISKFYDILNDCSLYNLVISQNSGDEFIKDGIILVDDVDSELYKKDGYIVVHTDKSLLKDEIKDKSGYFYYSNADMLILTEMVLELDYNGIIIKTPDKEFVLERHRLLKSFEDIVKAYKSYNDPYYYMFKLEE